MKKYIIVFFSFLSFGLFTPKIYSQKLHLELKSIVSNRVRKIYQNEEVIIITSQKTYRGNIKIIDKKYISLNGKLIKIEEILKIRKVKKSVKQD